MNLSTGRSYKVLSSLTKVWYSKRIGLICLFEFMYIPALTPASGYVPRGHGVHSRYLRADRKRPMMQKQVLYRGFFSSQCTYILFIF